MRDEISSIIEAAECYHKNILKIAENDLSVAELYKGSQVFFSPVIEKPKVLFIGINPGSGYFNQTNGERVAQFAPLESLEYLNHGYKLAKTTKQAFKQAGIYGILENNCVKINLYHFATNNVTHLWKLISKLCEYDVPDPETYAQENIMKLIDIIKPDYIICEGATAYSEFIKFITGKKKYLNGASQIYVNVGKLNIIGYSRKRDSGVKNIEMLSELLKEKINLEQI